MSRRENSARRRLSVALFVVAAFFLALRFVRIEADFPAGITRSGMLYTDEGWYANAAIRHQLDGRRHLEGDFNPIVNMPIGQLIQAGVFKVFGMSLAVARTSAAAFCVLLILGTYHLASRWSDGLTASWVALLLSSSYFLFAYSRLAILEIVMLSLVVAALALASSFGNRRHLAVASGSGLVLALAVLTKSTALFALPALLYLLSLRTGRTREKAWLAAAGGLLCVGVVTAYNLLASHFYPTDFSYFREVNLDSRLVTNPVRAARNIFGAIKHAQVVAPIAYPLALVGGALLLTVSKRFRDSPLVRLSLLWLTAYFAMLGLVSYHPPRYFLPLIVPTALLFGAALATIYQRLDRRPAIALTAVLLISIVSFNGHKVLSYMLDPKYSFVGMAREVAREIRGDQSDEPVILIGNFADTISLETGLRSINSSLGPGDLEWKLEHYRPGYYITLGNEPTVEETLDRRYRRQKVSEWNVFGNYHRGRKVTLFKLISDEPT